MSHINSISIGGEQFEIQEFPAVRALPATIIASSNTVVNFSVADSIKGSGAEYQWQYSSNARTWNNTTLSGYNTATIKVTATAARNGFLYRCKITYGENVAYSTISKLIVF